MMAFAWQDLNSPHLTHPTQSDIFPVGKPRRTHLWLFRYRSREGCVFCFVKTFCVQQTYWPLSIFYL